MEINYGHNIGILDLATSTQFHPKSERHGSINLLGIVLCKAPIWGPDLGFRV
jgi:hypothetical protein